MNVKAWHTVLRFGRIATAAEKPSKRFSECRMGICCARGIQSQRQALVNRIAPDARPAEAIILGQYALSGWREVAHFWMP